MEGGLLGGGKNLKKKRDNEHHSGCLTLGRRCGEAVR